VTASDDLDNVVPEVVADEYYWAGPEGNVGIAITGKFKSLEAMAQTLGLTAPVGRFRDRQSSFKTKDWVLRDILISMNLNANGLVATWRVSGPKPLLLDYVRDLEGLYKAGTVLYDFDHVRIRFEPTAFWEEEE
jgi:hypothetical protein